MDKVKIAIIGVGTMGSAHVATIDKLDNCVVSALCDIDPEVRKKYSNRKDTQIFASADELFAKGDFDAVIVAVPHYFHVPLALQALEHILYGDVKKLYAFTLDDESLRLLDRAAEAFSAAQLERSFRTLEYYKGIASYE